MLYMNILTWAPDKRDAVIERAKKIGFEHEGMKVIGTWIMVIFTLSWPYLQSCYHDRQCSLYSIQESLIFGPARGKHYSTNSSLSSAPG